MTYSNCNLCPRECGVDRRKTRGYCGARDNAIVAKTMLHFWEEPCVSGTKGSGAVFFSGCNLRCNFCQNRDISFALRGEEYTAEMLTEKFFELAREGAHNINLVTATPYLPTVTDAIIRAKTHGLNLPVVYNTGGYEKVEAIRALNGLVDVYLPDFKYSCSALSAKYSGAQDYPEIAMRAIDEMVKSVGTPIFENGLIKKGVIIRHLVLPGHKEDSKAVLRAIAEQWGTDVTVSVMRQFTPEFASEDCDLKRRITTYEYNSVLEEADRLGLSGYAQGADSATADYTPDFANK